jgi:hypothetical protein
MITADHDDKAQPTVFHTAPMHDRTGLNVTCLQTSPAIIRPLMAPERVAVHALTCGNILADVLAERVSGAAHRPAAHVPVGRGGRRYFAGGGYDTNTLSNNADQRSPRSATVRDLPEHDGGGRW